MDLDTIACADALTYLRTLPDACVHTIITSPPYFALRDYKTDGQIGLEDTPQAWLAALVAVFAEAKRVLRPDGTCWVNCGDSYSSSGMGGNPEESHYRKQATNAGSLIPGNRDRGNGLPPKSLMMLPARLAIALQDDGWILRSEIVWHKSGPMPESVTDRPTKSHEMVYLLTKRPRYFYDAAAIAEASAKDWTVAGGSLLSKTGWATGAGRNDDTRANGTGQNGATRNKRDVWTVASEPSDYEYCKHCDRLFTGAAKRRVGANGTRACPDCGRADGLVAHYAAFPQALIRPMILAGCPAKVCPECGAGWVREIEATGGTIGKGWTDHQHDLDQGMQQKKRMAINLIARDENEQSYSRRDLGFRPACAHDAQVTPQATAAGTVLDFFMGSGTTALAARALGRHYIGCDLSADYVALARARLRESDPYQHQDAGGGRVQLSLWGEDVV